MARRKSPRARSYTRGQEWGALKKAWIGLKIASANHDTAKIAKYQGRIAELRKQLGLKSRPFRASPKRRSSRLAGKRASPKRRSPKRRSPKRRASPKPRRR